MTSLLVPFLVVMLRVVRSDEHGHRRLECNEATKYIFAAMWTPVIMLLLGGFAIAAALSKYGIAKMMATLVLSKAGTKPRTVLLTNMFVAMFASMWISNVAAPVLCFSIIQVIWPHHVLVLQHSNIDTFLFTANAAELAIRFPVFEGIDSRNSPCFQHRRYGLPDRQSPKHHRPAKHEPSPQLG